MFQEGTKKRSWTQIVGAIVLFILILAIIGTFVLFGIFKDTNSAPSLFGYRVYIMSGDGMEPRIESGSAVFVKEGQFPEREGNVILCSIDGQLAVVGFLGAEEIITPDGATETRYIVKYDKAPAEEKWGVGGEDIIGVAKTYSKFFGGVVRFASSKAGMLTIVIIPCALVLIYEVTMFILSLKKKKSKTPVIEEPVSPETIKAKLDEEKKAEERKKKFVLDEGYLDKMPEEEPKPVKEIHIRKAVEIPAEEEPKLEFTSAEAEPKLEFTSDNGDVKPLPQEETVPADEPKIEIKRLSGSEPKKEEPDDSGEINIKNLSLSRIDDLMKMLEAEKQRLSGDENK